MSVVDDEKSDFVKTVEELLREGNVVRVLHIFNEDQYLTDIENCSWDVIPVLSHFLTEHDNDVFKCCEHLLHIVAEKSNADEALLQFIQEIEECESDKKILAFLKPLQTLLFRISKNTAYSWAWGFNALNTYLKKYQFKSNESIKSEDKILLEIDDRSIAKMLSLYNMLVEFYKSFIQNMQTNMSCNEPRNLTIKFMLKLFGEPLSNINFKQFTSFQSEYKLIIESLISQILILICDPFEFNQLYLNFQFSELEKPDSLEMADFFYFIFVEENLIQMVPKIYNSNYIFETCLHLVTTLLQEKSELYTDKGLELFTVLVNNVEFHSLSNCLLDSEDNLTFCKILTNLIIYNDSEIIRKKSLKAYDNYLKCFGNSGFYLLILHLMSIIDHSGLKGYTIKLYKEFVVHEFINNATQISVYCKGDKLYSLIKKFCYLHDGLLIEQNDQIMSALNFLLYLSIRDKDNITNIWNYFPILKNTFLSDLKERIQHSKAEYQFKIKEFKEEMSKTNKNNKIESSVKVSGETLSEMSDEETVNTFHMHITVLDTMSSVLYRLEDFIHLK